jgi:hypothetical protein
MEKLSVLEALLPFREKVLRNLNRHLKIPSMITLLGAKKGGKNLRKHFREFSILEFPQNFMLSLHSKQKLWA